jgi:hypothetical protein
VPNIPEPGHDRQRRPEDDERTSAGDQVVAGGDPRLRHVLAEEHHVRLEHPAAFQAVHDDEPAGLLQRHVPVRVDRRVQAGPRRVRRPQPLVKGQPRRPPPARQAHHPVQAAVQLRHRARARRLVQPVHVLRDDPAHQPVPLERGDRAMPGIRCGPGDVPPAEVAARPVPLPRRRGPGELLVRHRLPAPRPPARSPVIRYAGLRRQPRAAQNGDVAATKNLNHHPERTRPTPQAQLLHRFRARHGTILPNVRRLAGNRKTPPARAVPYPARTRAEPGARGQPDAS